MANQKPRAPPRRTWNFPPSSTGKPCFLRPQTSLPAPFLPAQSPPSSRCSSCPQGITLRCASAPARQTNINKTLRQPTRPLVPSLHAGYNGLVPPVSQSIRVKVLFFGRLKEIAGRTQDSLDLAPDADIESLFANYASRYPELQQYRSSLVASCNQEFAPWNTILHAGDEVAFLPPVSGG